MPVPFEGTPLNAFRAVEDNKPSLPTANKVKKDKEDKEAKSKREEKVSPFNPKKKVIQEV